MADEPLDQPNPTPAEDAALPPAPPDREPSAEFLDGATPEPSAEPTPEPSAEPESTPEPVEEPAYVKELRAEIAALKAPATPKPEAPAAPAQPFEPTPQQWDAIEKDFGFTVQEVKNPDTGEVTKSLNVNPRQLIKTVFSQLESVAKSLRQEFDGRLSENTADSRMDRAFYDLEKRAANPLTDIRQHQKEIKEYLHEFYNGQPQKWTDPKVLEAAYLVSVAKRSRQKPANPGKTDMKVIHPSSGRPTPRPSADNYISPMEREMMRGVRGKDGKPITDAEWIAARGKRAPAMNGR